MARRSTDGIEHLHGADCRPKQSPLPTSWEERAYSNPTYIIPHSVNLSSKAACGMTGERWEPGQPGPYRHYHTNLTELFYVLEGELKLQIGEQVVQAGPGTF